MLTKAKSDNDDNASLGMSSIQSRETSRSRESSRSKATTGTAVVNRSGFVGYVDPKVAESEQRVVAISKWVFFCSLLIVAAAFCTATYLILQIEEEQDFEVQVRIEKKQDRKARSRT